MRCRKCLAPTFRVHRTMLDYGLNLLWPVRRVQCTTCRRQQLVNGAYTGVRLGLTAGVLTLSALIAGSVAQQEPDLLPEAVAAQYVELPHSDLPKGADNEGLPIGWADVPVRKAPEVGTLLPRSGCAWGKPGANPYKGDVRTALTYAGLPPAVVDKFVRLSAGESITGRVEISNHGIVSVDTEQVFRRTLMTMTFGETICYNTMVNFPDGHYEYGDWYRVTHKGVTYDVIRPDVCGNWSVAVPARPVVSAHNTVPEPGTAWLIGIGLLGLIAMRRGASADFWRL